MRIAGIILAVIGILMMVFKGFNYTDEKKVVDVGPLVVNKKENHHVGRPMYAGGVLAIAGIIVIVMPNRKS